MKMFRALVLQIAALMVFGLLSVCIWKPEGEKQEQRDFMEFNQQWSLETDGETVAYEKLPATVPMEEFGDRLVLKRMLDGNVRNRTYLIFYSTHQSVEVSVGDELVYTLYPPKAGHSKTPGNGWNFVELREEFGGKELTVVFTNCYERGDIHIPCFYYGAKDSIVMWFVKGQFVSLILSIIILLIGLMLVAAYFSVRRTMAVNESVLWLGMFAIPLAVWSVMECQILTLFSSRLLLLSQITFVVLKLIPIPILQFVGIIYELPRDRCIRALCIASILDFWGCAFLQLAGLADFRETLWVTHGMFLIGIFYILIKTIKILWEKGERSKKSKRTIMIHAMCVGTVALCVLLDVISYYFFYTMDSARFCRLGLLIYIIVLAIQILNDSVQLIRAGQQADILRQEAKTDAMTKLRNRKSFEEDIYSLHHEELSRYGIVLCDLNNLKRFNDVHGHSMGDYYIIICSEVIQDIFGRYGVVYRIGGDEFCAIVKDLNEKQAGILKDELEGRLRALSGTRFEEPMEVAVGYAHFNRRSDRSLSDTMDRADEHMYEQKKEMKESSLRKIRENRGK